MDQLELTCPSCDQVLLLDAGFAGGVCRCSNCGTLMTVPTDLLEQYNTAPTRPDRPNQPSASPSPSSATRSVSNGESQILDGYTLSPPATRTAASSRTAKIAPPERNTPQQRRTKKRLGLYAFFVSLFLLMVGACALTITAIVHRQAQTPTEARHEEAADVLAEFEYNPNVNPFTLNKPNILGVPLSPRTTVVIDTGETSHRWLGLVKNALLTGTFFKTQTVSIQFVFATSSRPTVFPELPTELIDLPRERFRVFLNSVLATGTPNLQNAMSAALASQPDQIILITGQQPAPDQVVAIQNLLKNAPYAHLDALLIDPPTPDPLGMAKKQNSRQVTISSTQITAWYYETH